MATHLLLIGLRGAGKSTLGRTLAYAQGLPFFDLDDITCAFMGEDSVAEAWQAHGEPAFREAECRALAAVLNDRGGIIALGGGTPTAPGAAVLIERAVIEGRAVVAYLRHAPEELRERLRLAGDELAANRPSLTSAHPLDEIEEVFLARDPLYQRLATRTIEDVSSIDEALGALRDWESW